MEDIVITSCSTGRSWNRKRKLLMYV